MKKNTLLIIIVVVTLVTVIGIATYAYFATGLMNITNVANLNVVTERNNMVFDTLGGEMTLNVTVANMAESKQGNMAAYNDTTLTVNFTPNTDYSMMCTYDIIYEWTSTDRYTSHSPGATDAEFGIRVELGQNLNVKDGVNYTSPYGIDLADLVGNQNTAIVVSGAQIRGVGSTTSTAVWRILSVFINADVDQSALSGKTYAGRFKVDNVSCLASSSSTSSSLLYWFDTFDDGWYSGEVPPYVQFYNKGLDTGHKVYIGSTSEYIHSVCLNDGYNEMCLTQPYTQYGLEGHTLYSSFTSDQKTSAKEAICQAFDDAGMNWLACTCSAYDFSVKCTVGNQDFEINYKGQIWLYDFGDSCDIWTNGQVICHEQNH